MSESNGAVRKAFLLWLSGVGLAEMLTLPEARKLLEQGTLIELDPSPITGRQAQHYQIFSGQLPARFGFFDTLLPESHFPDPQQEVNGYNVREVHTGRGLTPQMIPDLLRSAGWSVDYQEASCARLLESVKQMVQAGASEDAATCKIVKCALETPDSSFGAHVAAISDGLLLARSWVGETGLLAVFSDIQPARVDCFVNINNFLAEMEILERDGKDGLVNWPNSLAYYTGYGQLWVNMLGREPQGAVHPQYEYEEVCTTLIKALPAKLRDPRTGAQVIERVYRKEDLYSREYLFCAPDLVVVFQPGYAPSPQSTLLGFDEGTYTLPTSGATTMAGAHPSTMGGFLLASAPMLSLGVVIPQHVPLTAVAPSLLHALGVEYEGMDSPAVDKLFSFSYLENHPIRTGDEKGELSEEDEELIINRLRDLGYV